MISKWGNKMVEKDEIELKIEKAIGEFVRDHWENTQSVCYLSSIGVYLNVTLPDSRAVLTRGLREFLRQHPVVQVVQFPGVEQKIGAVPLSMDLPEDIRELFSRHNKVQFGQNRNVYSQEFWNAFIRPIEELPRYVLVDEIKGITIRDGSADGEGGDIYEITPQDLTTRLPDGSVADKVDATHSAIDNWLKKHSLEPSVFLRPRRQKQEVAGDGRLVRFIAAFDGLPHEDLSRIKIPLDILVKLNSKK